MSGKSSTSNRSLCFKCGGSGKFLTNGMNRSCDNCGGKGEVGYGKSKSHWEEFLELFPEEDKKKDK